MNTPAASAPRGPIDRFIRRFQRTTHLLAMLALYVLVAIVIGIALAPALALFAHGWAEAMTESAPWSWLLGGIAAGLSLFVFGFALLVVVPLFNALLPTRVREFHGSYFTIAAVPWYLHNGLFYLVRYTFLPYVS